MTRWTPEQDAVVKDGYRAGKIAAEIAAELGRDKSHVLMRASKLGLRSSMSGIAGNNRYREINDAGSSAPDTYFDAVLAWGKSHPFGTVMQCVDELGISKTTVMKHVKAVRRMGELLS